MHALIAFAGFNLSFKHKKDSNSDREVKKYQFEAEYHLFQGIRLLNKNLEHPGQALSNASIITAQFLGSCTVRNIRAFMLFRLVCDTN